LKEKTAKNEELEKVANQLKNEN